MELCWTGSYIPLHGLDIILEAFRIVINRGIRCKLLIWGDDYNKAKPYIEYINKYGLENRCIVHNEWGNIKKWRDYMEEHCDVTLGIFGNSTKAKSVVANKVIDGIDFGTPVITGTSTGLDIYFDSSSLIIIDNSPEILADAIETIYNESFENIEKMTNKAYDIYKSYFSEDVFSLTLRNIINKIS